jgi:hypothetical protein
MTEDDVWILLDGPEPQRLRPVLEALRDDPSLAPESQAKVLRRVMARLEWLLDEENAVPEEQEDEASTKPRPQAAAGKVASVAEAAVTLRSALPREAAPALTPADPVPSGPDTLPAVITPSPKPLDPLQTLQAPVMPRSGLASSGAI